MATRETCQRQAYRRPAPSIKQEQDDDSDVEETHMGLRRADGLESQIIHSGHFMVSSPHSEHPPKKGYDFDTVNKQTCQTYHFGKTSTSHLSIDASLTKLFECMTLAYSGKLVSPKWKNFKGLKLLWRDKIRLNNAIWRAWYMQYVEKRGNPVCHFVTPLDGNIDLDVHRPAEAIASDGRNWKRRIEIVIREYHKWRTYFKKRLQKHKDDDLSSLLKVPEEQLSLFGEVFPDMLRTSFYQDEEAAVRRMSRRHIETPAPMEMDTLFDMDILMSEFSDTLFSTLTSHQPLGLPNPREIAHAGNADMIQPGLIPLQPNLDFMDSFDPLQDLFHSLRQPLLPSVSPTATSVTPQPSSSSQSQAPLMSSLQLSPNQITPAGSLSIHSQTSQTDSSGRGAYVHSYMPLLDGQMVSSNQSTASLNPMLPCLPGQNLSSASAIISSPLNSDSVLDETVAPSVITHTSPSTVTPSNTASTVSHVSAPPSSQLQLLAPLPATPIQHPQVFALPRPFQSNSASKVRPVPRIAPANTLPPSQFILPAPFPGHANAVIVTSPPSTGVVITPSHLGASPGFQVLPHNQKSSQPAVPEDKSCFRKNQKEPSSVDNKACQTTRSLLLLKTTLAGQSQTGSSQGSPCGLDQVPSPQSIISGSSKPLIKSEHNQSRHISAEQKRRSNINIGFKTLGNLVPTLKSQSNITNAVTLQKTVEHIGKLQQERQQLQDEVKRLREEIEELNASISLCQEQLPATGVPIRKNRSDLMQDKFNEYVKSRTLQNWKFWIFSIIIKPLFESFSGMVSTTSREELCHTTLQWLDNHCSLPVLRPMVLSTLRQLCTTTSILSDPSLLPAEALEAAASNDA
ncbi:MLX-interacting protein isoform X2 [Poeciliopsis prolifica]|uniref:MLX-interacting protein isoform X2 n=1 Tax=Poeciliopsis prolifica TaxID=188132 RepID=UPI0024137412|nr:MLX-interacting protein isoform X2 [Poeciliopsis prolifica]